MHEIRDTLHLEPMVFKKMHNIRFLRFNDNMGVLGSNKVSIHKDIQLPLDLRYLKWDRFSSSCLPPNFVQENVIELALCYSQLEQFFIMDKVLFNSSVLTV